MTNTIKLTFENLGADEAAALSDALVAAQGGAEVTLALTYHKVTATKPRIAGEDYRALLGTTRQTLIGRVLRVAVGKNGPYITLDASLTRGGLQGEIGFTTIKPEGVDAAQVVSIK